ncbi:hypothetical protein Pmani_022915 [Petrolisthes manimaculis]|uniref:Uncharacterized protein n=1 Tax=Petrolisthes manimaculis TaxID=1843537 RepID=A0AAE1PDK1_9EUCA|nr:hypothetical protein Pmani_022915 [Petrolisthes manimaculis]
MFRGWPDSESLLQARLVVKSPARLPSSQQSGSRLDRYRRSLARCCATAAASPPRSLQLAPHVLLLHTSSSSTTDSHDGRNLRQYRLQQLSLTGPTNLPTASSPRHTRTDGPQPGRPTVHHLRCFGGGSPHQPHLSIHIHQEGPKGLVGLLLPGATVRFAPFQISITTNHAGADTLFPLHRPSNSHPFTLHHHPSLTLPFPSPSPSTTIPHPTLPYHILPFVFPSLSTIIPNFIPSPSSCTTVPSLSPFLHPLLAVLQPFSSSPPTLNSSITPYFRPPPLSLTLQRLIPPHHIYLFIFTLPIPRPHLSLPTPPPSTLPSTPLFLYHPSVLALAPDHLSDPSSTPCTWIVSLFAK